MLENAIVITFSGSDIHREYQKEFKNLYKNNFFKTIEYTHIDIINTDFYKQNMQMFKYKKYFGYFLWKPYIIIETLKKYPDKEILYCDSNLRFTNFNSFETSYKYLMNRQGTFFIRHENFINKDWTKRDTFILMDADNPAYWTANQVWTPLMGFNNNELPYSLLSHYWCFCSNPQIVTEEPNKLGENLDGFREHRWEQSVMSILVKRYGFEGIPDTLAMNWITKLYSNELVKQKEKENADPLSKSL